MSYTLRLECPSCHTFGEHPVVETDPTLHGTNEWAEEYITTHLFGRDASFRSRIRMCGDCLHQYETVEVDGEIFDFLLDKLNEFDMGTRLGDDVHHLFGQRLFVLRLLAVVFGLGRTVPDSVDWSEAFDQIEAVLETLTEQQASVVRMRFGAYGTPQSWASIGEELGVSSDEAFSIGQGALSAIRHPSRSQVLGDYVE